jgi:predicted DNA-binding transcriptional regulator YafY
MNYSRFGLIRILTITKPVRLCAVQYFLPPTPKTLKSHSYSCSLLYYPNGSAAMPQSDIREKLRYFKLNLPPSLNSLDRYILTDKKFIPLEYFNYAWSLLRQSRIFRVELRFLPEIAAEIAKTQWHHTQTVSFQSDGSAVLEFTVDSLNQIIWWILNFGCKVEVLAPLALKQRVARISSQLANQSQK